MKNETIKCILSRRSVRSFSDRSISREDLGLIAEAARLAPSAKNSQLWKFTVLQSKELMNRLSSEIAVCLSRGDDYDFYSPNALLIASCDREYEYSREDCACALENAFLAAHSLGIGSVWINQLFGICGEPSIRKILDDLKIPSSHDVYGMAALGYPDAEILPVDKKTDNIEFIL
ncbi:MAG: NAD(P)H nitroreductase [Clostridiales bacterium]|jgi:nitroreductase|nr:NAD(P)H nitroreductase [Clostridiales bacterium]